MSKVLLALFVIAVVVYAATDSYNASDEERRGLPRGLWLLLIVLLPGFGAVAWFLLSSAVRRANATTGGTRPAPGARPHGTKPSGPVAPDDDPDFLWRLEQERRRAAREQDRPSPGSPASPAARDAAGDERGPGESDPTSEDSASTDPSPGPNRPQDS